MKTLCNAALLLLLALRVGAIEVLVVNTTGSNCHLRQPTGGGGARWKFPATVGSATIEMDYGTFDFRPDVDAGSFSTFTLTQGLTKLVLLNDNGTYKAISTQREDTPWRIARALEWFGAGFAAGLAMLGVGWGFRMVRAASEAGDPEP